MARKKKCCRPPLWISGVPYHTCIARWMQPHIEWLELSA